MRYPEICIAGAGIIGLSLALELHHRGASVAVLDQSTPLSEASSAAAGMLAFWAGTVPSLIVVGWIGHFGLRGLRGAMARLTPAIMALNSVALIGLALRWVV